MALINKYEITESGFTVENAYHVISDVQVDKKFNYIVEADPDSNQNKSGYRATIYIQVFANKDARDQNKKPIGYINDAMPEIKFSLKFMYDPESSDSVIMQAYNYLKTINYYKDAQEV